MCFFFFFFRKLSIATQQRGERGLGARRGWEVVWLLVDELDPKIDHSAAAILVPRSVSAVNQTRPCQLG
jgi:hypothetical protein